MWFKNLQIYRLPAPWAVSTDALNAQLQKAAFQPCGNQDSASSGFVPPQNESENFIHALDGQWLLQLKSAQKLLPAAVVNEEAALRAADIEEKNGFFPGRKAMRELKEQITAELLPRAFVRSSNMRAWIDPVAGIFAVDAGSSSKADVMIGELIDCLNDFPLKPLHTAESPSAAMTDWLLTGEAPAGFTLDRDCELKSESKEKPVVRYVRHPLEGDEIAPEIRAHLAAGKLPTRLALTWESRLSFILTDKLEIKRIQFLDVLEEEAEKNAESSANAGERLDADFALMTGEFRRFIPALIAALGGEMEKG